MSANLSPRKRTRNVTVDFHAMFSSDEDEIQSYIDKNKRYKGEIDASVVALVNKHVKEPNFANYIFHLPQDQEHMMLKYHNLFFQNTQMNQIIRKKIWTDKDLMFVSSVIDSHAEFYLEVDSELDII